MVVKHSPKLILQKILRYLAPKPRILHLSKQAQASQPKGDETMIDQTKDKKDDVLVQKLDAKKEDSLQAQKLAQEEQERIELAKAQGADQKIKAQPDNNMANAMQPIGSAKVSTDKAEIHSEPEKRGTVIGSYSAQQKVDVLERRGNELKVLVDGKIGYIAADQTDFGKTGDDRKQVREPTGTATVTCAALRIRRNPGDENVYLGTLRQADRVNIYGEKDGYLEVHVGDQIGYISAEFTDYAGKDKGKSVQPKEGNALEQAPDELKALLSKEALTGSEISTARTLIAACPEAIRGDLYEALQTKPSVEKDAKDNIRPEEAAEFGNLASSLEMLGIQNPSSSMSYASYLAQLKRDQKLPDNGGMQNWGSLANAMGVSYEALCTQGDTKAMEQTFWSKNAREQLRNGHAVMACINNQAVRVEAVEDKGLVITLPDMENGAVSNLAGWQSYHGKAEQKGRGRKGILSFDALKNAGVQWAISLG